MIRRRLRLDVRCPQPGCGKRPRIWIRPDEKAKRATDPPEREEFRVRCDHCRTVYTVQVAAFQRAR